MVEEVIIDFQFKGEDQLQTTLDSLLKAGVNPEIANQFNNLFKRIKSGQGDVKGLAAEFKNVANTAKNLGKTVEQAFEAGIKDALDEAGVSMEEFQEALTKANAPAKSLKAELKELKEALALAKVNGQDTGEEFERMRARAGALADAINDAGAEIKNAGSDTRNIDNLVGSISAMAGGFAAAQGAVALFGDENEDLQKALLKVNGAMAIASGVQQFYNATLKEGALTKLADSVATGTQTAVQKLYTLATGKATAATLGFKAALIATGVGAFVVLILALVSALNDTDISLDEVNRGIDAQNRLLEASNTLITQQTDLQLARAKAAGASESELIRISARAAQRRYMELVEANRILIAQRDVLKSTSLEYGRLNDQIAQNAIEQKNLANQIAILNAQGAGAVVSETKERIKAAEDAAAKAKALRDKESAEAKAARLAQLRDTLAGLEQQLLFAQKNSAQELELKKAVVRAKRDLDVEAENLTANQVRIIRATAYKAQLDLQEEFNKRATESQIQSQIDTNARLLAGVFLSNEERLRLNAENITLIAQQEINAAEGNSSKILLIEAKRISDLRALRNAAIKADLDKTISSAQKSNDVIKNALLQLAADQKQSVATRIAAIEGIGRQELVEVDRKIAANEQLEQSDQEYQDNYKKLADERAQIEADTAQKVSEVREKSAEERRAQTIEDVELTLEVAGKVVQFYENIAALGAEKDRQRIEEQKRQLDALVEAGAISEKNAKIRAQQIEIAERQARQRQAQREKQAAVFNALLAIPQSYLTGLKQGGLPLAIIYGALAAANAALVIARPVPKFFRGKKDKYEGPGEVADMGSEIVEREGRMYLYTKPTQTYLGRNDKVYTAAETRKIMHNTNLNTTIHSPKHEKFDYERLGKAIPKHSIKIDINKDFIKESVAEGLQITKYFDKRYKF